MAKRVVTLDIDSTTIRLLEVSGNRVVRWASGPLEPGIVENGVISDPEGLGIAIRRVKASSGITGRRVAASVSGRYSMSRILSLPAESRSISRDAVLHAAKRLMPEPQDDLYLSWMPTASDQGGRQFYVVGVPQNMVDTHVQALRLAGLTPDFLDTKAVALARVVDQPQALIVNIEPAMLEIALVVDGSVQAMRTLALKENLDTGETAQQVSSAVKAVVGFYDYRRNQSPLNPATTFLFLTGQIAADPQLVDNLRDMMEYPIMRLTVPLEYPPHLPLPQYAVNLGLAVGAGAVESRAKGPVTGGSSLVHATASLRRLSPAQAYAILGILVAIALLGYLYDVATTAGDKTDDLRASISGLDQRPEVRDTAVRKRDRLTSTIAGYRSILEERGSFIEDLDLIDQEAGELGVQVSSVSHTGREVTISYNARDYTVFDAYYDALAETERFLPVERPAKQFPFPSGGTVRVQPTG